MQELGAAGADAGAAAGMGMLTAKESVAAAATAYVEVAGCEMTKWCYPAAWSNCCDPSAERSHP